ncbi:hypothetical protein ACVWZL_002225 [Bradyrhizobium sp. GM2.4]
MKSAQHRCRGWKQQAQRQVAQQHRAAIEPDMGEGERRHRGDDQGQGHREGRDDQRVAQELPVACREQDVGVILPLPVTWQAERIDAQLAERFETTEQGRKQRDHYDDGDDGEEHQLEQHCGIEWRADRLGITHRA